MIKLYVSSVLLLLFSFSAIAGPAALPARVGGSIFVGGTALTKGTAAGYVVKITGKGKKEFSPAAEDIDGLNNAGKYIIDIPLFDPANQPKGAKPGSSAFIHVYKNGVELKVEKPVNGEIKVGKGGTITPVNLFVLATKNSSE